MCYNHFPQFLLEKKKRQTLCEENEKKTLTSVKSSPQPQKKGKKVDYKITRTPLEKKKIT